VFRPGDILIYFCIVILIIIPLLPEQNDKNLSSRVKVIAGNSLFFFDTYKDSIYTVREGKDSVLIEVKNRMVRIKSSTCRDKYCEKKGWLKESDSGDIICMPNRIIVSFVKEGVSEIDAVTE